MIRLTAIFLLTPACWLLHAQAQDCCAVAPAARAGKIVELSGVVGQIQIVAGQGSPYFELKHGAETTRIYLGPMPFLIAENFNPKSGQEIVVKGYPVEDWIVAARVTLVADKRTVQFRDDQGWPLWRGRFGRGAGAGGQGRGAGRGR